ncbi:hypothetical protein HPB52_000346 [Rhipicephalus sanguineus]|uniref:Uncharacterized protein n=1 Tax=Rhipicephalus sanguineus TaxID=34632 RepID=A0A9D4PE78_RHISA|nr:hypothetical protein HPB52_000346 [Rhipicephalus sanguineus]
MWAWCILKGSSLALVKTTLPMTPLNEHFQFQTTADQARRRTSSLEKGDHHPDEPAGPSRLPTDGSKMGDRVVAAAHCDSSDSSSIEELESEADFTTFSTRQLKRKLRKTSSSRDSQPATDHGKQLTHNTSTCVQYIAAQKVQEDEIAHSDMYFDTSISSKGNGGERFVVLWIPGNPYHEYGRSYEAFGHLRRICSLSEVRPKSKAGAK